MRIKELLADLGIPKTGQFDDKCYIIKLEDSDEYAAMFSILDSKANNLEFPSIESNTGKTTTKISNMFEYEYKDDLYSILLVANFDENDFYIKIGAEDDT